MAYFIDQRTIDEIISRVEIDSVISQYVDLKKVGSNYKGLCPFHSEKTPSFTVSPSKGIFKCFGCGEGGNVISFLMKIEGLSFPEACKKLGDEYGIQVSTGSNIDADYQKSFDMMYQINREIAVHYMKNLTGSKPALKYLFGRGFNQTSITKFGIGYGKDSWNDVVNHLKSLNYDLEEAHKAGVIGKNKSGNYYDYYRNRIIFPIIDTKSRVLGFGARALGDDQPKYLNTSDSPIFNKGRNLYGLNNLDKNKKYERLILVEGYVDVIALETAGIPGAIASLGTAFTQDQARLIKKYTDNIYISYDGDSAGREATKRALNVFHSLDWDAKVIELKGGMDPDNYINKFGKFKYEVEINNAKSGYNFLIEDFKRSLNLTLIEDQVELIKFIGNTIKRIKSPIERELQVKKLAEDFGVSPESIKVEIFGRQTTQVPNRPQVIAEKNKSKKFTKKDRALIEILKLILEDPNVIDLVKDKINLNSIENNKLKEVYLSIISSIEEDGQISKQNLLKYLLDNYIIDDKIYVELNREPEAFDHINKKVLIDDLLVRLKTNKNKLNRIQILEEIRQLESNPNKTEEEIDKLKDLISQLMELNKSKDI